MVVLCYRPELTDAVTRSSDDHLPHGHKSSPAARPGRPKQNMAAMAQATGQARIHLRRPPHATAQPSAAGVKLLNLGMAFGEDS